MRRYIFPLILGIAGCAALIALGIWQLGRIPQKAEQIAAVEAEMSSDPRPLPAAIDPSMKFAPVWTEGDTTGQEVLMISGTKEDGGGYQVISAFQTDDGRRILIDRGFIAQEARQTSRPPTHLRLAGHLHWPDEATGSTPAPDLAANIWFARDVPALAAHLKTEPVLIVMASAYGDLQEVRPMPLTTAGIPNNHLGYAIQWFGLAIVWAGMTAFLIWRIRRRNF